MRRPLTDRQVSIVNRLRQNGGRDYVSPDVAKQLAGRGVVTLTGKKYQRHAWNRPVKGTTLWEVRLAE